MKLNILASKSTRRNFLLNQIGFNFSVVESNFQEKINNDLPPNALSETLARGKALKIAKNYKNNIVIGADTIVYCSGQVLGKPKDENERFKMLKNLSGKSHEVITGISIIAFSKGIDHTFNQTTLVTVKNISNQEIKHYSKKFDGLDKAGGYGIQDGFSLFVEKIEGCYFNIVGFPIPLFYTHYNNLFKSFFRNV